MKSGSIPLFETDSCWFISDLHLTHEHPEKTKAFFTLLHRSIETGIPVICAGDLFHFFIGKPSALLPFHKEVERKLRELKKAGLEFIWIRGNRDILPELWNDVVTCVTPRCFIRTSSDTLYVEHGDTRFRGNLKHILFRALLTGRHGSFIIRFTPSTILLKTAFFLARMPSDNAFSYPGDNILLKTAENILKETQITDEVLPVLGHYHVFAEVFEHSKGRKVLFLPSWDVQPNYVIITHKKAQVYAIDGQLLQLKARQLILSR